MFKTAAQQLVEARLAEAQEMLRQERNLAAAKDAAVRTTIADMNNANENLKAQLKAMQDEIGHLRMQSSKPTPPTHNTSANIFGSEFPEFSQSPSPISTHTQSSV